MEDAKEAPVAWGLSQISVAGIVTLMLLLFTFLARRKAFRKQRLPPGPRGWPVLGSLLSMSSLPYRGLDKLSKKYGPIMFLHLGYRPTLVLSNAQMAEAIFKTNDQIMASRPRSYVAQKFSYNYEDMASAAYGPHWRYVRKLSTQEIFTTHRINQFQNLRQREVMEMLHSILEKAEQGEVVIIRESMFKMTMNNLTQMMFNKSYFSQNSDSSSEESKMFHAIIKEMLFLVATFNVADFVPIFKHFDLQGYYRRADAVQERFNTFIESVLMERRKDSLTGSRPNFADALLSLSEGSESSLNSEERLSMDAVKGILSNMIIAGIEVSSTTLEWTFAELLKHPKVLQRAREELDLVVGKSRLVEEADIPKLKYLQAIVKEIFRLHTPLQLLGPRESIKDCEIEGFYVPAGTGIFVNAWSIHRDPNVWERPLEFNPDRFMGPSSTMDMKGNYFGLLPFGAGRRICPGMNLGILMVQYPLAQMLHTIKWTLPTTQKPEELDMSESFELVCAKAIPLGLQAEPRLSKHVIYPTNPM